MDIKKAILAEHSKSQCDQIVAYIGDDKERFSRLMAVFLEGDYILSQRAAWPVSQCIEKHPELVKPYYSKLLAMLINPGVHMAVLRNITRLFQYAPIPKRYHGKLMDACFGFLLSKTIPVAVKAFSISILEKMTVEYPEILPELKLAIEENLEHATPAIISRARNIMK